MTAEVSSQTALNAFTIFTPTSSIFVRNAKIEPVVTGIQEANHWKDKRKK
jgi:hypothetical protein